MLVIEHGEVSNGIISRVFVRLNKKTKWCDCSDNEWQRNSLKFYRNTRERRDDKIVDYASCSV